MKPTRTDPGNGENITAQGRYLGNAATEYIEIVNEPVYEGGGMSPGQMIDNMLAEADKSGKRVAKVSFELARE